MPIYSWLGTSVQLQLPVEAAEAYNRIAHFYTSDTEMRNTLDVAMSTKPEDLEIWRKIENIIIALNDLNRGDLPLGKSSCESDYLVQVPMPEEMVETDPFVFNCLAEHLDMS